jgi:orotate phosphoribosyltransferase
MAEGSRCASSRKSRDDALHAWENRLMDPADNDHRTRFLKLALRAEALRFGEFTLKSGRTSPYFFNAGRFDSGAALAELAGCYADAPWTMPGWGSTCCSAPPTRASRWRPRWPANIARRGRDLPLAFNRKEAKAMARAAA